MLKIQPKTVIFIIVVLVIIVGIIIINVVNNKVNKDSNSYLIVGNSIILEKKGNNWQQLSEINDSVLEQKYTVKTANKTYNDVSVSYASNSWYYVDKNYKDISNVVIAYSNMKDINIVKHQTDWATNSDLSVLQKVLEKNDVSDFLRQTRKTVLDYDGDGEKEYIYTTTNASLSYTGEKERNVIFAVNDGKINIVEDNEEDPYLVMEILDIDGVDTYELIVSKGSIDIKTFDTCYQIYKIEKGTWKLIKDCQA